MSESTAAAACTEAEFQAARGAGLLVATTADEAAIHKFAEAIRSEFARAGKRWLWKNSDESQYWRYSDPPIAKPEDLVVQQLYVAHEHTKATTGSAA